MGLLGMIYQGKKGDFSYVLLIEGENNNTKPIFVRKDQNLNDVLSLCAEKNLTVLDIYDCTQSMENLLWYTFPFKKITLNMQKHSVDQVLKPLRQASVLIIDSNQEIILEKYDNVYRLPRLKLAERESPLNALSRELSSKLGCNIPVGSFTPFLKIENYASECSMNPSEKKTVTDYCILRVEQIDFSKPLLSQQMDSKNFSLDRMPIEKALQLPQLIHSKDCSFSNELRTVLEEYKASCYEEVKRKKLN